MNNYSSYEPNFSGMPPRNLYADRHQIAAPALAVSVMFAGTVFLQLLLLIPIRRYAPWLLEQGWFVLLMSNGPMYAVAMPLSLFCYHGTVSAPPQQKKLGWLAFLGLVPICFALTYIGSIMGSTVNEIIGTLTGTPIKNELQELSLRLPLWATLLFMGLLAPVFEEIFYRKFVIDRLLGFGELPAVLMSGLLFGLIHANFSQFFYAVMIGMVFAYIYIRTGRLRYTIALHMIINLVSGVYANEIIKRIDITALETKGIEYLFQNPIPTLLLLGYCAFLGICFLAAPIAIALLWKHIRWKRAEHPLSASDWVDIVIKNPAVWVLAVTIVAMVLL